MSLQPRAQVREVDGQLVLDDPDALAVIKAIGKVNCASTLELQRERVEYFKERIALRQLSTDAVVIVLLNVNDPCGAELAEHLMPHAGPMWDEMRTRGELPFARGLAAREGVTAFVGAYDTEARDKLQAIAGAAVVVMDHGVIEVFPA